MPGGIFDTQWVRVFRCSTQLRRHVDGSVRAMIPDLYYFAAWYILGVIGFWIGFEPKGRTFEEIDDHHGTPERAGITDGRATAG